MRLPEITLLSYFRALCGIAQHTYSRIAREGFRLPIIRMDDDGGANVILVENNLVCFGVV